ncbi:MAG: exosortase H-associated membrane protein [bacterium]
MKLSPLKTLLLSAILWMPLGFTIWFYLGGLFAFPTEKILDFILPTLTGGVVDSITQSGHLFDIQTSLTTTMPDGRVGTIFLNSNPLIYGYGLPMIFGLVMSSPISRNQSIKQLVIGTATVFFVQCWGISWEILKKLQFQAGPEGQAAIAGLGLNQEVIAFFYQMGYLIFPSILPVIVWVLMNRVFVEGLVNDDQSLMQD